MICSSATMPGPGWHVSKPLVLATEGKTDVMSPDVCLLIAGPMQM